MLHTFLNTFFTNAIYIPKDTCTTNIKFNVTFCPFFCFVSDLRKFKEAKKQFDKVSEEKEAALIKNAQAPRNKQHEVEEATNILTATRKCFRHIVLDYVLQVGRVIWGLSCITF